MVKFIKMGQAQHAWPIGATLICDACGCEFMLVPNDLLMNWKVMRSDQMQMVVGNCPQPGCNHLMSVERVEPIREVA